MHFIIPATAAAQASQLEWTPVRFAAAALHHGPIAAEPAECECSVIISVMINNSQEQLPAPSPQRRSPHTSRTVMSEEILYHLCQYCSRKGPCSLSSSMEALTPKYEALPWPSRRLHRPGRTSSSIPLSAPSPSSTWSSRPSSTGSLRHRRLPRPLLFAGCPENG